LSVALLSVRRHRRTILPIALLSVRRHRRAVLPITLLVIHGWRLRGHEAEGIARRFAFPPLLILLIVEATWARAFTVLVLIPLILITFHGREATVIPVALRRRSLRPFLISVLLVLSLRSLALSILSIIHGRTALAFLIRPLTLTLRARASIGRTLEVAAVFVVHRGTAVLL
jgi:hypothetical protein